LGEEKKSLFVTGSFFGFETPTRNESSLAQGGGGLGGGGGGFANRKLLGSERRIGSDVQSSEDALNDGVKRGHRARQKRIGRETTRGIGEKSLC